MPNLKALVREGLVVERDGSLVRVRLQQPPDGPTAEVLLPADHPLDAKALKQLAAFASVRHPAGGSVHQAFATPDFHAGAPVPIGCVLVTSRDMVIPQAIGTDINCGMRLHVADLSYDQLIAQKTQWLGTLKGDLLLSTRDLPMDVPQIRAMFRAGALEWLEEVARRPFFGHARASRPPAARG